MSRITGLKRKAVFAEPSEHEQPDFEEELSDFEELSSHRRDLTTFTNFSKLPVEIRLQIFRDTFPRGQSIDLQNNRAIVRQVHPPVALMINRESRAEALRHSIVVAPPGMISFFFNPILDNAHFTINYTNKSYSCYQYDREMVGWLKMLKHRFPKLIDKVTALQCDGLVWSDRLQNAVKRTVKGKEDGKPELVLELLACFPNLSNLKISRITIYVAPWSNSLGTEEMLDLFTRYLEHHKASWNGRVPKVELESVYLWFDE